MAEDVGSELIGQRLIWQIGIFLRFISTVRWYSFGEQRDGGESAVSRFALKSIDDTLQDIRQYFPF